jgi:methyltransferase (TIGR00027 family)
MNDSKEDGDTARCPSHTALSVARHRADHQLFESGVLLEDTVVSRLLGEAEARDKRGLRKARSPLSRKVRTFLCLRSLVAEREAMRFVAENQHAQIVVLGAGLDTFAIRERVALDEAAARVYEVDLRATQQWKRLRLRACCIEEPSFLRFASMDLEREQGQFVQSLAQSTDFDVERGAFFMVLGVVRLTPCGRVHSAHLLH